MALVDRAALLDQRVAWLAVELTHVLEHVDELTPYALEALLACCSDVAAVLERRKLAGVRVRSQASGPEELGP